MKHIVLLILLTSGTAGLWAGGSSEIPGPGLYAEISTNRGTMLFVLDSDRTPLTVINFCGLAEGRLPNDVTETGQPYFDGMIFYRDASDYAVFSGDPDADGTGGPGYTIPREYGALISAGSGGVLAMDGFPGESSGSRFFITRTGDPYLDSRYTVFGRIVSGEKVLKKIGRGDVIRSVRIIRNGPAASLMRFDTEEFERYYQDARAKETERLRVDDSLLADAVEALGDDRQKSPTGIYYRVITPGEGPRPGAGSAVSVHYTGSLTDGTVFDSSLTRGQTFDFVLGTDGVIPGWIEMLTGMQAGEVRQAVIPPGMAYGNAEFGPIAPGSWLIFEMELISFSNDG